MRRPILILALATALPVAACGTSTSNTAASNSGSVRIGSPADWPTAPGSTAPESTASAAPSTVPDDTVWLCQPGLAPTRSKANFATTSFDSKGVETAHPAGPAAAPPIDCFYVYP